MQVPEASKEMILSTSDDHSAAVKNRSSLFSFQGTKSGFGKKIILQNCSIRRFVDAFCEVVVPY